MYPGHYAQFAPDRPAVIEAESGRVLTYKALNDNSNRLAQYLYGLGLRRGDHIALFMENNLKFFEVIWAALRSGLYLTCINRYFTAEEAAYIVNDCEASVLIASSFLGDVAGQMVPLLNACDTLLMSDGAGEGWLSYEDVLAASAPVPLDEEPMGDTMLYSSGTTGRPKGIRRPLPDLEMGSPPRVQSIIELYGFDESSRYLSPAPLYHSAPLAYCAATIYAGGTIVMMKRFDAERSLAFIERYRVTHSQWVPTMFVRMLKLPDDVRTRYDLSSHKIAIHAAAPCPVPVKYRMIEWWGPIIHEFYAGTEGNGSTVIDSEEWLRNPGSVGRSRTAVVHICDDEGHELPTGEAGTIYFEQEIANFEYFHDEEKTRASRHPQHDNWTTLGDIGYLNEAGYLFLTDRKAFMIISGGVNIYPQEVEDALIVHPKVFDVAVIGVPNEEFGEEVKAIVQVEDGVAACDELSAELIEFAREKLAHYMVPRSIDFIDEMPRLPTGKLYKRLLRDRYWGNHDSKIV